MSKYKDLSDGICGKEDESEDDEVHNVYIIKKI